jgi:hypothetical protein
MNNIVTCNGCSHLERVEVIIPDTMKEHNEKWVNLGRCDHTIDPITSVNDVLDVRALRICEWHKERKDK